MLGDGRLGIEPQLLSIVQPGLEFPMLASHVTNNRHNLEKRSCQEKIKTKINNQILKINTYRLSQLVNVVIMDKHPIFGHALKGLPIQVAGK